MKSIKLFIPLVVVALLSVSCVEKSAKFQALVLERDSIQAEKNTIEANYNESLEILNEVENGFSEIREIEKKLTVDMVGVEGKPVNKKQQIVAQLTQIKEVINQNKARLEQLQQISGRQSKENSTLAKTIERMEKELADKTISILALQDELAKSNIRIGELTTAVDSLSTGLAQLNTVSNQQKSTIKKQDTDLNKVWYCVATTKVLKDAQIVSGNGLFRAKTVLDGNYDKGLFVEGDLRTLSTIATGSSKAKVLSVHPKESYSLTVGEDKKVSISIVDQEKFWSISKYLVVQI